MKKKILLAMFGAIALTSCSDEDNGQVTDEPELKTLKRAILYAPQQENYVTKTHFYYENNEVVTDSTFNSMGVLQARSTYILTGNTRTITQYDASGTITGTIVSQYDLQGRIISHELGNHNYSYVYNNDGSITASYSNGGSSIPFSKFTVNTGGLLETQEFLNSTPDDHEIHTVIYSNGKPVELLMESDIFPSQTLLTFSYYTNPIPENMIMSATKINNDVLKTGQINNIGHFSNFSLNTISNAEGVIYSSDKAFNPVDGYMTWDKRSLLGNGDGDYFYEYNE